MTDAQSAHLKKRFLDRFRKVGNVSQAAKGLCGRRTVYDWKHDDPAFLSDFEDAEIDATESLEREARRRAIGFKAVKRTYRRDGTGELVLVAEEIEHRCSDVLLIFLLKSLKPEKYRERYDVNQHVDGKIWVIDVDGTRADGHDGSIGEGRDG